jgi:hypothetical protein
MDVAEKRALELSPAEAFSCFSPAVYIAWVMVPRSYAWMNVDHFPVYTQTRYYAQWLGVLKYAHEYEDIDDLDSDHSKLMLLTLRRLGVNPALLCRLDFVFEEVGRCNCSSFPNYPCQSFRNWR